MTKLFLRVMKIVITGISILCIGSKVNHEVRLVYESKELQQLLASELVELEDNRIHTLTKQCEQAEDTIVFLHGLGMGDTTITTCPMLMPLEERHSLFVMDRYGNGLSEDSHEPQTVENIVGLYRNVLQKTEQKAPYILIAHSVSGIYATYWAQQYPQEIRAVIYLDADPAECYVQEGKIDKLSLFIGKSEAFFADMGLQRIFISDKMLLGEAKHQVFTEEQNRFRKYLMYHNTASYATCSEMEWYYENAQKVVSSNTDLQMPQLYIMANNVQGEYYDKIYAHILEEHYDGDEEQIREKVNSRMQILREKRNNMSNRSNMEIAEVSGPHCLYEYNPEYVAQIIVSFLEKLA